MTEYDLFEIQYCCTCKNDEGCDRVPIDEDGSIMGDFSHMCRDYEEIEE